MEKTLTWTGSKGNEIELRAHCTITMQNKTVDLDGHRFVTGKEPSTSADLELWIDGKKIDSCWDTNFWKMIDFKEGYKKIWGLEIAMTNEQAEIVEAFLNEVIESGKSNAVIVDETAKAEAEKAEKIAKAQKVVDAAAKYTTPLMTDAEYRVWATNYNNVVNEGGDGYVPSLITVEQLEYAKRVLAQ